MKQKSMQSSLINYKLIAVLLLVPLALSAAAQTPRPVAFPGAEGFGKYATGGRMGEVYHVTNLNDAGEGSLRDAVSKPRRIVVFDVGGVIRLQSPLTFLPNQTIAGQTAPGDGICVYGHSVSFTNANNLICRYVRFRLGAESKSGGDAVYISTGYNMIFDHVSVSWGKDENFSVSLMKVVGGPTNITVQNSIIGQGLGDHSMGGLIHSDGGVTLYRNLYIDNRSRNVKAKGITQFVSNVVYNWVVGAYILGGNSEFSCHGNVEDCYFITGPDTRSKPFTRGGKSYALYAAGNYADDNRDGKLNGRLLSHAKGEYDSVRWIQEPFDFPKIKKMSAEDSYRWILRNAGCNFPARDEVDTYMIDELASLGVKGKCIASEMELPFKGAGAIRSGAAPVDTDRDGMPDAWETANKLDPKNPADGAQDTDGDVYTNVEEYLNGTNPQEKLNYRNLGNNVDAISF
jgi:hypothetical protein